MLRAGLVLVLWWIGALKFTASEEVFTNASVLPKSWRDRDRHRSDDRDATPRPGEIGRGKPRHIAMFLNTLSFSADDARRVAGWVRIPGAPGQFLLKDVVLLGAAPELHIRARGQPTEPNDTRRGRRGDRLETLLGVRVRLSAQNEWRVAFARRHHGRWQRPPPCRATSRTGPRSHTVAAFVSEAPPGVCAMTGLGRIYAVAAGTCQPS